MFVPFDSLPAHSRLWVYQANRKITASEKEILEAGLMDLCSNWSAHGTPLQTSFVLRYDRFVVMAVNEAVHGASGCSIDSSVNYLKSLQSELGLDFFDRSQVAFIDGQEIFAYPFSSIKTLIANQTLSSETLSFDNAVSTKADWEKLWVVPVKKSWMARFLPKTTVAG
ncbi:MAG: hypothetical protein QM754_19965 [Tepidisphaeraceae bacterium]